MGLRVSSFNSFLSPKNLVNIPIISDDKQREINIITPAFALPSILTPTAVIINAGPPFIQKIHNRCACFWVIEFSLKRLPIILIPTGNPPIIDIIITGTAHAG